VCTFFWIVCHLILILPCIAQMLYRYVQADGRAPGSLARSANYITLVSMDNAWSDHLQNMENLKENVYLRKYQDLDPADEYKRESLAMFEGLLDKMRLNTIFSLWQSLVPAILSRS
jgi:preprotein translocase subunit SecA